MKTYIYVIIVLCLLIAGLAVGYCWGNQNEEKVMDAKKKKDLNEFFDSCNKEKKFDASYAGKECYEEYFLSGIYGYVAERDESGWIVYVVKRSFTDNSIQEVMRNTLRGLYMDEYYDESAGKWKISEY